MPRYAVPLRVTMVVFISLLLLAIGSTVFFVYTHVYSTIGDVRSLIIQSDNFGFEIIDFRRLETVQGQWDIKHSASTTHFARDPFTPVAPPEIIPEDAVE